MEDNKQSCPKCNNDMLPGGVLNRFNKSLFQAAWGYVAKWIEGAVELDKAGYINVNSKDVYMVITYRCVHCGYLESYAKANE